MLIWQKEPITRGPVGGPGGVAVAAPPPAAVGAAPRAPAGVAAASAQFRQEVTDLVHQSYAPGSAEAKDRIDEIVAGFELRARPPAAVQQAYVANVRKVLAKRAEHIKDYANVLRKKKAFKDAREKPGELDAGELAAEVSSRIPLAPGSVDLTKWGPDLDLAADTAAFDYKGSGIFDLRDQVDHIISDRSPVLYTHPYQARWIPGHQNYDRLLARAEEEMRHRLAVNTRQLDHVVETGSLLSAEELPKRKGAARRTAEDAGMAVFDGVKYVFDKAGTGIWSHSDYLENVRLKRFYKARDRLLSDLVWSLNPTQGHGQGNFERLKKVLEDLQKDPGNGMLDEATFKELLKIVTDELGKAGKASEAEMAQYTAQLNELNAKVLEAAKAETTEKDDMAKYRMLQLALLVTPFFGVSILGPVSSLVSGTLMNGGLAHGIASLTTSEVTGPFGLLCELLHIDDFIELLLTDVPIVNNTVEILDSVVGSHAAQTILAGAALPLMASPLSALGLAGINTLSRANTEITHHLKHSKAFQELDDKLKEQIKDLNEKAEAGGVMKEADASDFVAKKMKILQKYNEKMQLALFAQEQIEVFDWNYVSLILGQNFVDAMDAFEDENGNPIRTPRAGGGGYDINRVLLNKFLQQHHNNADFLDRVALFKAIRRTESIEPSGVDANGMPIIPAIAAFQDVFADQNAKKDMIAREKEIMAEDYVIALAEDFGCTSTSVPPRTDDGQYNADIKKAVQKLEQEIKQKETASLMRNCGNFAGTALGGVANLKMQAGHPSSVVAPRRFARAAAMPAAAHLPPPIAVGGGRGYP